MNPPFWVISANLSDARRRCSHALKGGSRRFVQFSRGGRLQTGWTDKWKQELPNTFQVFSWRCHYRLVTTEDGTTTGGEPELNTESLMSQWEAGVGAGEAQRGELCRPPPRLQPDPCLLPGWDPQILYCFKACSSRAKPDSSLCKCLKL